MNNSIFPNPISLELNPLWPAETWLHEGEDLLLYFPKAVVGKGIIGMGRHPRGAETMSDLTAAPGPQ